MAAQGVLAEGLLQEMESKGLLVHKAGSGHLEFQFDYLGFPFAVRAEAGSKGSSVNIRSVLGYLPYSSEALKARHGTMKILTAASRAMGQRVWLDTAQRLMIQDTRTTRDPLTPVNLVTIMVNVLLEAKPYLSLMAEYLGHVEPSDHSEDGNSNICPG